jgi:putative tricarboxylic transport membrane protein
MKGKFFGNREVIGAVFLAVFATAFLSSSLKQGLFLRGVPGPGFLPFLCSSALFLMALVELIRGIFHKAATEREPITRTGALRIVAALGSLFGYALILRYAGFAVSTFLFILVTLRILEPAGRMATLLIALAVAVVGHVLFVVLLGVPLPQSPLGIF